MLTTGDCHISSLAEADAIGTAAAAMALDRSHDNGRPVVVPSAPSYTMLASFVDRSCMVRIASADTGAGVLTVAVAADLGQGVDLWRAMHEVPNNALAFLDPFNPPPALWCAARYEQAAFATPREDLERLLEVAKCIGWAWLAGMNSN